MTKTDQLKTPFKLDDIEWRVQRSGIKNGKPWAMVLAYVDARAVQDRLDEVVGVCGWQTEVQEVTGGILCKLSIKIKDEWITKTDGSPETQVEAFKGGISKALVRVASQWGIGRYLYGLDANFAECTLEKTKGWNRAQTKEKQAFYWKPPIMPAWALPGGSSVKVA